MIKITPAATQQIELSAKQSDADNMSLRIAATIISDNSFHYGMGFDEKNEIDTSVSIGNVEVIISPDSAELLKNTTLDYVELEPGKHQFIFMNPNDPEYKPSSEN